MAGFNDELLQKPSFHIEHLLVEGRYTPNAEELLEKISKINLVEEFKDTRVVNRGIFTLSFDTRDHAHLFALYLGAEGHHKGIFSLALSDEFFQTDLLEDFRPDGVVLSLSENIRAGRNEISIVLQQGGAEYRGKLTDLVKEVVASTIPNITTEVTNLAF